MDMATVDNGEYGYVRFFYNETSVRWKHGSCQQGVCSQDQAREVNVIFKATASKAVWPHLNERTWTDLTLSERKKVFFALQLKSITMTLQALNTLVCTMVT